MSHTSISRRQFTGVGAFLIVPRHILRGQGQTLDDIQRHGTGDRHLLIVDPGNGKLHEFWEASNAATFDLRTGALRPEGWTSADAAGLPIFPASVRG